MMYKCLLVCTGYLRSPSDRTEGGRKNPGTGIQAHPQWSPVLCLPTRPSLHSLSPGGRSFWVSSCIHLFCSPWLSPSLPTHTFFLSFYTATHSPWNTALCLQLSKANFSYVKLQIIPSFREAFPDCPSPAVIALLYFCRTVDAPVSYT